MLSEPLIPGADFTNLTLGSVIERAISGLYDESGAAGYGITPGYFQNIVAAVVTRYAANDKEAARLELIGSLRIEELVLARACSAGNQAAWDMFIARFRGPLYATAYRITKDETRARELADGLNADLYGIQNKEGRRVSKLDYYTGRGSLEGWLRTVIAREHIDNCRSQTKEVSLDEQIEAGVCFAESPQPTAPAVDCRVTNAIAQTLAELGDEERFLLASYYLDQRTLADIGRQIGMHESTVSRKLDRLIGALRKRVRRRLVTSGIKPRRCDELLRDLDVRDMNMDVAANLKQERPVEMF